ncbi:hypothetical protein [Novipirellula artificiosorum]|uniref:hypothetical protein n=1 Tax=Novipirellula artificiosorum TaxID=2528016 RepID=UPI0018CCC2EE|nr:hypothetical protein [Novipirellula artificiosorum]
MPNEKIFSNWHAVPVICYPASNVRLCYLIERSKRRSTVAALDHHSILLSREKSRQKQDAIAVKWMRISLGISGKTSWRVSLTRTPNIAVIAASGRKEFASCDRY